MVDTARSAAGDPVRHAAVLEAVAHAAERLLLAADWREAADEVLGRMGRAAGASRAFVIENHTDETVRPRGTIRHEWCAPGVESRFADHALDGDPGGSGLGEGAASHARGEPVVRHIGDLPEADRSGLVAHGVVSTVEHPIFVGDGWWGTIGFDDCERERRWSSELDALRAAATLIGASVTRHHVEGERRVAERRWRQVIEHIPAVTYIDVVVAPGDVRMEFVSPQVRSILGYEPERFLADPSFWFTLIHPEDLTRLEASGVLDAADLSRFDEVYRMRAADDTYRWIHDTSTPVVREDGELDHFLGFMMDVTERMHAQENVRQAEERYRLLVERTPAITYTESIVERYEPTSVSSYLSPQIEAVLGHPLAAWETPGFWLQVIHPDDRDRVMAESIRTNGTLEPYQQEYRMIALDGREVWIHDESVVVRDALGNPLYWQGVMLDVTERKHAEEQLRQAEQRYRALIEHIPAVVYRESPEGEPAKFYISPQVEDLLGYTPEGWTWTPDFWRDRIHPDDQALVYETNDRSNETKEPYTLDYRFRHADGRWVWVHDEATFVPAPDDEGFWQGFLVDITERKEAEERLREAELKFRTIVEQNQAIFYTQEIDPDDPTISLTTYIAPGNTDLIGYTLEDIRADPTLWRSIIHPDDRERVLSADAESNTTGGSHFSMEYRMIAKDGRIVWVQDEARLVELPGKPPYWQGFLLDVTERKESQAQLERALAVEREATQRLRSLDEMKNTFLQAVSHDLRTPLAAILGLAITLERGDVQLDEADSRDLAGRIAGNARRLERLVTNLLDMDRLARGIVAPQLEETDVGALVGRVVEESELVPRARLVAELAPVEQSVDAAKVERIVENLLANAVRHAPATATVWVRVQPHPAGVVIAIEDDGPGVPEDLRETVFEAFRQGPDAPSHSPGVGVGLTLVRRFAELQGGRAWVQEREGGGASFRVFLPADAGASGTLPPPKDGVRMQGPLELPHV
ncbi:MAG: PAS domain-containing protein [Actinomycetota bacterium]